MLTAKGKLGSREDRVTIRYKRSLDFVVDDKRTLAMLYLAAFISMYSMRCTDSILPALAAAFGTTPASAAVVVSAYALGYGMFQLVVGPLGDRYHKLSVCALATLWCTLAAFACALSPSLAWLRVNRFASGAAAACIIPLTTAWIGDHIEYARRQETLARLLGATIAGMVSGQSVAAVVAERFGWRSDFLLLGILFGIVTALLGLRQWLARGGPLAAPRIGWVSSLTGVLSLPWSRQVLAMAFLEGAFAYGALAFVPLYLHMRFGLSMVGASAVLVFYGLGGLIYSGCARHLLRGLQEKHLAAIGGLTYAIGVIGLAAVAHWKLAVAGCALAGFGFYTIHGTLQTQATQMAPASRGTAMSLFSCLLFLGQSVGVGSAARLADQHPDRILLVAGAGLLLLSGIFAWTLGSKQAEGRNLTWTSD